jgi:hypothetical protein
MHTVCGLVPEFLRGWNRVSSTCLSNTGLAFKLDLGLIGKLDTTALLSQSEGQAQPDEQREGEGWLRLGCS